MNKSYLFLFIFGCLFWRELCYSLSSVGDPSSRCSLIWSDEFDVKTSAPNPENWYFRLGANESNQELQYYTSRLKNARVENGNLLIESHLELLENYKYTSARMMTRKSFKYGYVEVRAKLPIGKGSWPAIWMLSEDRLDKGAAWPLSGEIDIMEHVGYEPNVIHSSIHTQSYNWIKGTQKTKVNQISKVQSEFQIYALDWRPDELIFYINKKEVFRYQKEKYATKETWPFDQPFKIILNNAVGGVWGGKFGVDNASFPQQFLIDYVRIYQNCH